jgi:hypothetical protein
MISLGGVLCLSQKQIRLPPCPVYRSIGPMGMPVFKTKEMGRRFFSLEDFDTLVGRSCDRIWHLDLGRKKDRKEYLDYSYNRTY